MRFAIWCAVSSKAQAADDKVSLTEQETRCRAVAISKGWLEACKPYIVPGASRSFYVNLSDAEEDIPQLAAMLNAAQAHKFDVLIFFSYDRLGDLANMIAQALRFYGVQLLSVSQGTEVQSPETFDPYQSDAESNMRTMSQMIQQFRIADMRRKFRKGMEKRIADGLNSTRIPYAYSKPVGNEWNSRAVPVPVPSQSAIILEIKDLFLHGKTYYEIMHSLNLRAIPTPQGAGSWSHTTIKKILLNPFYAGKVFFGRRRVSRDVRARGNSTRMVHNPNPLMQDGRHEPLYSWDTYQAILAEVKRRNTLPRNNRFQFSGLLTCSLCGGILHHGKGGWRCPFHVVISDAEALALIPKKMQQVLSLVDPTARITPAPQPDTASELQELTRQRRRVQQAYDSEIYTLAESEKKIKDVDQKINALNKSQDNSLIQQFTRQAFLNTLAETKDIIHDLPKWIRKDDPRKVNLLLHRLFRTITITPDIQITVHLHG